ncbi:agmatinase [Ruegeria marina]|uniref:Guanidinopropionase n=1 Tax=Ruegeria marina TaxID=639004 RepID=A0A1G6TU40_9RHOB|nr:agmatinase [Ruegeria marina]SDD32434.1 guanidinopropionase [Ruegeria marina]
MAGNGFQPVSGFDLPRFAGIASFMRLPVVGPDDSRLPEVDIGLIGLPWDAGTTNRPGPRHGPRQVRDMSTMIRAQHGVSGVRPFETVNCADLGDVPPNPADLTDAMARITEAITRVRKVGVLPVCVGGDHLCTLPVLRALAADAPLGLVHFDSHTDLFHSYFGGSLYTHGTPFRRAVEEGLLDPARMIQIGIRGTAYDSEDREFAADRGIRIVTIEELFDRGLRDVMAEARLIVGTLPAYVSYDIDFIDPAFAPGTGTPEVGGPTAFQALQVVRELAGVNIAGADLVEVSPPFDTSGGTAFLAASILFEMLCVIAPALAVSRTSD